MLTWMSVLFFVLFCVPWLLQHALLAAWVRRWRLAPRAAEAAEPEGALVVIPARDEADNIQLAVRGALAMAGVVRVVVVDDESTDGTAELAAEAASGDPRFTLVSAAERPAGWAGKCWACTTGAPGDEPWIVFMDADVRPDPSAFVASAAEARSARLDLFSAFGSWETPNMATFWLVPAFGWVVRAVARLDEVDAGLRPFANGQWIVVRRSVYAGSGGHRRTPGAVLDDVELARTVQAAGGRVGVRLAPWLFRVRPYRSMRAILLGWRKNLAPGAGGPWLATVAALGLFVIGPGPAFGMVAAGITQDLAAAMAATLGLFSAMALRARLDRLDGRPLWASWTHPAGLAVVAGTLLVSAWGPPSPWRGRRYPGGMAEL